MNQFNRNIFLLLCLFTPFIACKNSTGNAVMDNAASDKVSADASSSVDASFSAVVDGQTVIGKGTGELQLQNAAFLYPAQDKNDKYILFDLISVRNGDDFYTIRVYSPDKEGSFAVENAKKEGYRCSVRLDFSLKSTDNFATYDGDVVTVNIQKLTSSRISGTFSGEFKLSDLTRSKQYKAKVSVTDGKFDIPFSTGKLRPE